MLPLGELTAYWPAWGLPQQNSSEHPDANHSHHQAKHQGEQTLDGEDRAVGYRRRLVSVLFRRFVGLGLHAAECSRRGEWQLHPIVPDRAPLAQEPVLTDDELLAKLVELQLAKSA